VALSHFLQFILYKEKTSLCTSHGRSRYSLPALVMRSLLDLRINSNSTELIIMVQLAALQVAELLIFSTQFSELTILILVTNISVCRNHRSTEHN